MIKGFFKLITKIFKSKIAKEIIKVGVDAYVRKNDNNLTKESAKVIKNILDEID